MSQTTHNIMYLVDYVLVDYLTEAFPFFEQLDG